MEQRGNVSHREGECARTTPASGAGEGPAHVLHQIDPLSDATQPRASLLQENNRKRKGHPLPSKAVRVLQSSELSEPWELRTCVHEAP